MGKERRAKFFPFNMMVERSMSPSHCMQLVPAQFSISIRQFFLLTSYFRPECFPGSIALLRDAKRLPGIHFRLQLCDSITRLVLYGPRCSPDHSVNRRLDLCDSNWSLLANDFRWNDVVETLLKLYSHPVGVWSHSSQHILQSSTASAEARSPIRNKSSREYNP